VRVLRGSSDLGSFFRHVREMDRKVLFLDYDGTLAPFTPDRNRAFPYREASKLIAEILRSGGTQVVIVSGRAIKDITKLIGLTPLPEIWGSHGWEHLTQNGVYELSPLDPLSKQKLSEGRLSLSRLGLARQREDKPVSVAVHWRSLPFEQANDIHDNVMSAWSVLTESSGLEIHHFDGGLELRVRGRDKGFAVENVLSERNTRTAAAYLGDDLTDEDAFRAMAGKGLRVLVRSEFRETLADVWLRPLDELLEFLRNWRDAAS
jgi:trehalose 6-phosphate phosphatase